MILLIFWPALTKPEERDEVTYSLTLFAPLFLFYLFISFQQTSQANWAAAAYVSGLILLAFKASKLAAKLTWPRWLGIFGLLAALFLYTALPETSCLHLPPDTHPLHPARASTL